MRGIAGPQIGSLRPTHFSRTHSGASPGGTDVIRTVDVCADLRTFLRVCVTLREEFGAHEALPPRCQRRQKAGLAVRASRGTGGKARHLDSQTVTQAFMAGSYSLFDDDRTRVFCGKVRRAKSRDFSAVHPQRPPLACSFPLEKSKTRLKDRALAVFVSA
jgi:hypothetical protein